MANRRRKYTLPAGRRSQGSPATVWIYLVLGTLGIGLLIWWFWPTPRPSPNRRPLPAAPIHSILPPLPPEPGTQPVLEPPQNPVIVSTQALRWTNPTPPAPRVQVSTQAVSIPIRPAPAPNPTAPSIHSQPWTPRPVTNILEAQVALARHGINAGAIDGVGGSQTAAALRAFQLKQGIEATGRLDRDTLRDLQLDHPPFIQLRLTADDFARVQAIPATWLGKSQMATLDHESILERAAERAHAHPSLLRRLNGNLDWNRLQPGADIIVPNPQWAAPRRAARVRVSLAGRYLRAFDDRGRLLCHFPCSIGRVAAKRPVGDLHVTVAVKDPNYTFDPRVFPESAEGRALNRKLVLPPGPNNPVGVAWIGLDRPGYGIHGTPVPEQVGRTESHGCFRLANWNADYLRQLVWVGMPVSVEP